jgi:pimeloyl-ACP methyl ester carboxylesterase
VTRSGFIDAGAGAAVVLVPGIQGRWEWMRPTVRALAARCRVLTASLPGDPGSGVPQGEVQGFENLVQHLDWQRVRAGLERVAVCGVSFGGLVALAYAAGHPGRVTALVLVSTPGPRWRPDRRVRRYVAHPVLLAPLFAGGSPARLAPEILRALDGWWARVAFTASHLGRVLAFPMSPSRMSARVEMSDTVDFLALCRGVRAPALVVTGEPELDRVVNVEGTREYVAAIDGARALTLERTGHIGLVTRPERFAEIVGSFVTAHDGPDHSPC